MTTVLGPAFGVTIPTDGVQTGALLDEINVELGTASVTVVGWDGDPADFPTVAAGLTEGPIGQIAGTVAVALAAVNVFGGFLVTQRMLEMFKKKEPKAKAGDKKEHA